MVDRGRILVVEDEAAISEALCRLLRQEGYEPIPARSGREALAQLASSPPHLAVLDLRLPDIDGYEVCRRLRTQATYIPVVMLTAKRELVDKLIGLEVGADAYLGKPFEPRELLAQIRAIFRLMDRQAAARRGVPAPPLQFGHLRLWEEQHRLEVEGAPCELAPKEFELLRLFLQHPGRVFGRETLLRQVWGYDFLGDSRTVDVHIQRLRARIERNPAKPQLIRTVRSFGYRLATATELAEDGLRA